MLILSHIIILFFFVSICKQFINLEIIITTNTIGIKLDVCDRLDPVFPTPATSQRTRALLTYQRWLTWILAYATDREPRYDAYTYVQAHTGVVDTTMNGVPARILGSDEDGERAINLDERKKGEA